MAIISLSPADRFAEPLKEYLSACGRRCAAQIKPTTGADDGRPGFCPEVAPVRRPWRRPLHAYGGARFAEVRLCHAR
jgi:hypothetical protein